MRRHREAQEDHVMTGRYGNYAAASKETPKVTKNLQKLGRRKEGLPYRSQREHGPNTLI